MLLVMLNPSTADEQEDDPTIRRCVSFARREAYAAREVVNLYAYRATDPSDLDSVSDPVGPENDRAILLAAGSAGVIVAAWGAHRLAALRAPHVLHLLDDRDVRALGLTKSGQPRHPLAPLVRFGGRP
jgi:hypothetical protein